MKKAVGRNTALLLCITNVPNYISIHAEISDEKTIARNLKKVKLIYRDNYRIILISHIMKLTNLLSAFIL